MVEPSASAQGADEAYYDYMHDKFVRPPSDETFRAGWNAARARDQARIEELLGLLNETYEYAKKVDGRMSPWVITRGVKLPPEGPELGERVRAALAAAQPPAEQEPDDWRERHFGACHSPETCACQCSHCRRRRAQPASREER